MANLKNLLTGAVAGLSVGGYEGKIDPSTEVRLMNFVWREKSKSECVNTVTYNPVDREMTVAFQQRGTYKYYDVPLEEYIEFDGAGSRGTYFNLYVRNRYQYERVA